METRNNSGAIFKNEHKKTDSQPDYKGKVVVNNKEMEIALWVKTSAKGMNYLSANFSEPYIKPGEPQTKEHGDANDDLPF